jgi:hypothetical protein
LVCQKRFGSASRGGTQTELGYQDLTASKNVVVLLQTHLALII